jgi:hypothetical protein
MTAALYDLGRQAFLEGDIDWMGDDIRVVLIHAPEYSVNLATHQYLVDIPALGRVAISDLLDNKTATAGVADADDVTFTGLTGSSVQAVVAFQDTGDPATSRLIFYNDEYTNLPFTPNGGDLNIVWDNGADRIFKL